MGPGISLQSEIPVQAISSKRYDERDEKQSELQNIRLWQLGRHQYLLFFRNITIKKYKEYKRKSPLHRCKRKADSCDGKVEYFKPVEPKSKTKIKLEVHLPGMIRRNSKSKSPLMISDHFAHGSSSETGLIKEVDWEDLRSLDHLTIEFSSPKGMQAFQYMWDDLFQADLTSIGKAEFLSKARFHGMDDDEIMSPLSYKARSSTV